MGAGVVVVGAGSAGCVVAARLSEAGEQVVLLEAGPDYPAVDDAPEAIRDGNAMAGTDHDWGYQSEPTAATPATVPVLRGKVVGGSSAVNSTLALRPRPSDFDQWTAAGNDGWAWEAVMGTLRQLEDDAAPGDWHGRGGPVPIRRFPEEELRPVHRAFLGAAVELGFPAVDDHNAPGAMGAGPVPLNQVDGVRQSAAMTHLAAARRRPNLLVRPGVTVDRVEVVDGTARAVVLADGERIEADRVVLSAGTYGSPAILIRSGIGDAADLAALGAEVVADLPAVGRHLRDHPMFILPVEGRREALGSLVPPVQTLLTLAADGSDDPSHLDLEVVLMVATDATAAWLSIAPGTLLFGIGLVKPRSVGQVTLPSTDPEAAPVIRLNFYDDGDDLDRMVHGVGVVRDLLKTAAMAPFVGQELLPPVTGRELAELIPGGTLSYAHGTGTCRMGPDPQTSVVDQWGNVHGVDGLSVIDASVIPALPSAPVNLATMMVAERCVDRLTGATRLAGRRPAST